MLDKEIEMYKRYMFTSNEYFESSSSESDISSQSEESSNDTSSARTKRSPENKALTMMENRTAAQYA